MKKLVVVLVALLFPLLLSAQQVNYIWTDTVSVSTGGIDSTFTTKWETCSIWFSGAGAWVKYSCTLTDTASWTSRDWVWLPEAAVLYFDNKERLSRFSAITSSGTVTANFSGTKKVKRY